MGASNGKVALMNFSVPINGQCPVAGTFVDLVGYGSANCSEGATAPGLGNTLASIRRGNGCQDTDNNSGDLVATGPIPRNSLAPANLCGGDPTQPSGLGIATPDSVDPASNALLTVRVTPATAPPSTGLAVVANLSVIGGASAQSLYDDGTHGDLVAGDNTFSFQQTTAATLTTGAKYMVGVIGDAQGRTVTAPITLTIQSPTCGVERWSVKVGTDDDVESVDLAAHVPASIAELGAIPAPPDPPGPPDNARLSPAETTVYVVDATMTFYKKETDVDYHIVLDDGAGHTLISEIPSPACILRPNPSGPGRILVSSPLGAGIAAARAKFDARLNATTFFQTANFPVRVKGVGFFDFEHGQTGIAPNGIELHPVLDISFRANTTTTLLSTGTPTYGEPLTFTATVTTGGENAPTGDITFFYNGSSMTVPVDANGQASFTTTTIAAGAYSMIASYAGDDTSVPSGSAPLAFTVAKAPQSINFAALPSKTFGDPPFTVTAAGGASGNPVTFAASGDCTSSGVDGSAITLTTAGSCTIAASQAGNDNYDAAASVSRAFSILDLTPPVIASVTPSVASIWPPNKRIVGVSITVAATDDVDPAPSCQVTTVSANEGSAGDAQVSGRFAVSLRADRDGNGGGRVYTIGVRCVDASGNASSAATTVTVPHDQGQ